MSNTKPLVSISCITYNHRNFIVSALEGFLAQKTNFSFEVLIHDDASTDGTAEIIKSYAEKYPDIIKPYLQKNNQYSKGIRGMSLRFNFPRARGKYIALCEGDDYWTDSTKLQRQVDFLENNKDYSLVFHSVNVHFEDQSLSDVTFPENKKNLNIERLLEENFIQTNSVMYRARKHYDDCETDVLPGDWYLHLYHAQFGKIGFLDRTMSVYRRHEGGVWWDSVGDESAFLKRIFLQHMKFFTAIKYMYNSSEEYIAKIAKSEEKFVTRSVNLNLDDAIFLQTASQHAPKAVGSVLYEINNLKIKEEIKVAKLNEELQESLQLNRKLLNSISYKVGNAVAKPWRSIKKILK